jgi:hypothetical protein
MVAKGDFDDLLDRLSGMSRDHFAVDPERVDWGHVGTLREPVNQLRGAVGEEEDSPAAGAAEAARAAYLAGIFVDVLHEQTTPAQFEAIRLGNADEPAGSGVCHSHDFVDANMTMAEAFRRAIGRDFDGDSDADVALWNAAWEFAIRVSLTARAEAKPASKVDTSGFWKWFDTRKTEIDASNAGQIAKAFGWTVQHTGGHCLAFERKNEKAGTYAYLSDECNDLAADPASPEWGASLSSEATGDMIAETGDPRTLAQTLERIEELGWFKEPAGR